MPGALPYAFVEAAVLAWPFASEAAFRGGVTALAESRTGVLDRDTQGLAATLIEYLRPRVRGISVEVLRQVQESVWLADDRQTSGPTRVRLAMLLARAAQRLLQFQGGRAVLRNDAMMEHQVTSRWRWISLAMTPDLLVAAHAAAQRQEPPTDHVTVIPPHLWTLLDEMRLANTHLHFGAAVPFEVLWTNLVTRVGTDPEDGQRLNRGGIAPLGGGEEFLAWLTAAAVTRAVLAGYLWQREVRREADRQDLAGYAGMVAVRTRDPGLFLRSLSAVRRGSAPPPYARMRPLIRRLLPAPRTDLRAYPRETAARSDPLARWLGYGNALPETRFLTRAIGYLLFEAPSDASFARLFWQYVRIRTIVYRHLVQEPGTSGLDWFSTHYNRISPLRGRLSGAVMATALELESRTGRLESLEVRTSPPARWVEVLELVQQVAWTPSRAAPRSERGLVLHFLKQKRQEEHRADHADPRQTAHGCRFGAYFWGRAIETMAIEAVLRYRPEVLVILRGIDVCSVELSQPTWVFLPLIARLRTASLVASAALAPRHRIPPLRVTMHAGEDFRRLSEGLRRIHEPIEFGAIQHGDRLGHAVALGVPPTQRAEDADSAPQPTLERLDDLLWEIARYRAGDFPAEAGRVEWVRGEIERLSRSVYGWSCTLDDLLRARELRHNPAVLRSIRYPFLRGAHVPGGQAPMRLLWEYLTSGDVYVRGERPVSIPRDEGEIRMLDAAQRFLRAKLAAMPVVVEVNPSSNMLIGDLRIEDHPAFRLYPLPGDRAPDGVRVPVSLGDDDPVTFATTLADEIGHLYFALIRRNVSSLDAQDWLRGVASNGFLGRFTLAESILSPGSANGRRPSWVRRPPP